MCEVRGARQQRPELNQLRLAGKGDTTIPALAHFLKLLEERYPLLDNGD